MPNILTRAQRLVELSHKATAGEWIVHKDDVGDEEIIMVSTGIKDVAGYEVVSSDGGLFPWDGQRKYAESDANASFIAASRNDGPAIAQALVDTTSQLRTIRDVLRRDTISAHEATEIAAAMLGGLIAKLGGDGDE